MELPTLHEPPTPIRASNKSTVAWLEAALAHATGDVDTRAVDDAVQHARDEARRVQSAVERMERL